MTVTAVISGAPGTTAALITAAGCVGRRVSGASTRTRLRWELDAASARFARLEVRDGAAGPARRDGRVDESGVAGLSEASPDSDDGQTVVNTREIGFIAGNERDAQRDGDRRNEEIGGAGYRRRGRRPQC